MKYDYSELERNFEAAAILQKLLSTDEIRVSPRAVTIGIPVTYRKAQEIAEKFLLEDEPYEEFVDNIHRLIDPDFETLQGTCIMLTKIFEGRD